MESGKTVPTKVREERAEPGLERFGLSMKGGCIGSSRGKCLTEETAPMKKE
ncbi:MAG: hypothetical protein ABSA72_11195 [Nitrososphaerales archaeon]|jgi:hypothetical protein